MSENTLPRWHVVLTEDAHPSNKINTFTWANTRGQAYARVTEIMDRDDWWNGWSFTLAERPDVLVTSEPRTSLGRASDYPSAPVVNRGAF